MRGHLFGQVEAANQVGSIPACAGAPPFDVADRWARELRRRAERYYDGEEEHVPFPSTDLRRIVLADRATSPTLEDIVLDPSNTRSPMTDPQHSPFSCHE